LATRWEPWESNVEAGNLRLVKAPWNRDLIDEHCAVPKGKYKDQIDAAAGAFAKLVAKRPFYVSVGVREEDRQDCLRLPFWATKGQPCAAAPWMTRSIATANAIATHHSSH
jgi:hypothetical protein